MLSDRVAFYYYHHSTVSISSTVVVGYLVLSILLLLGSLVPKNGNLTLFLDLDVNPDLFLLRCFAAAGILPFLNCLPGCLL